MNPDAVWTFTDEARSELRDLLTAQPTSIAWQELRRRAEKLALTPGFDRLVALEHNTIKELPHQIDVAMRVLRAPMRGRAILADEVGLGKTIEAGLILKELAVRGLARRVLVLCPASLVGQWQAELETKFFEKFATPTEPFEWARSPRAIASYHRAMNKRHKQEVQKRN